MILHCSFVRVEFRYSGVYWVLQTNKKGNGNSPPPPTCNSFCRERKEMLWARHRSPTITTTDLRWRKATYGSHQDLCRPLRYLISLSHPTSSASSLSPSPPMVNKTISTCFQSCLPWILSETKTFLMNLSKVLYLSLHLHLWHLRGLFCEVVCGFEGWRSNLFIWLELFFFLNYLWWVLLIQLIWFNKRWIFRWREKKVVLDLES